MTMSRDFTLEKYCELLQCAIGHKYELLTVADFLTDPKRGDTRTIVLRHDVDRDPCYAWRLGELEANLGVRSTMYFRFTRRIFRPEVVARIASMGHEVGYHYEVLDRTRGDIPEALERFGYELAEMRKVAEVKTAAMHGNPLTPWDNRDIWGTSSFADFNLLGEAYLSMIDVRYLSDAGRTWSQHRKIKDWMPPCGDTTKIGPHVQSTNDVIAWLGQCTAGSVCLSVHPERWAASARQWIQSCAIDALLNVGKLAICPIAHCSRCAPTVAGYMSCLRRRQ